MGKFNVGDKVKVLVDHYGDDIPKGTTLTVVADGRLGAYWINTTEVEVSMSNGYPCEFKLVEESSTKPVEWHDGLPPIGTRCIYRLDYDVCGVIVAHVLRDGEVEAIIQCQDDWWCGEAGEFYPIKTKEQQEAEEREETIKEIERVIRSKMSDKRAAESLYELGYRKMEQDK